MAAMPRNPSISTSRGGASGFDVRASLFKSQTRLKIRLIEPELPRFLKRIGAQPA